MALTVSNVTIKKETLLQAYAMAKKIKRHLSSAEGQKMLEIAYLLINDVVAQLKAKRMKPTQQRVMDAVLPTILRIEDDFGWDMPFMGEETEDRFLTWVVGRAVDHVLTGSLHPSRV